MGWRQDPRRVTIDISYPPMVQVQQYSYRQSEFNRHYREHSMLLMVDSALVGRMGLTGRVSSYRQIEPLQIHTPGSWILCTFLLSNVFPFYIPSTATLWDDYRGG